MRRRLPFVTAVASAAALMAVPAIGHAYESAVARLPQPVVIADVAETSVDVLHKEFRTSDGRDAQLPAAVRAGVIPVNVSGSRDRAVQVAELSRGPLGHPKAGSLYYVRGTRLLVYYGATAKGSVLADAFHGTGTASLAAGRTVGSAPEALVVVVLGYQQQSWDWVGAQSWIDLATTSTFDLLDGAVCNSVTGVRAFRAAGGLPFVAAGNGAVETTVISPGGYPAIVRVGGVRPDGTTALPDTADPAVYSGRLYDLGGLFSNRIAAAGTLNGYTTGTGTSGSSPQVAGRVADLLRRVRLAIGDNGGGLHRAGLAVASRGRAPARGPLADGALTSDELLDAVLNASRPARPAAPGRYLIEGYGWFSPAAEAQALAVVLGRSASVQRSQDDTERTAALAVRTALYTARGCGVPS
jgi:hypothetical protein